jgi:hypothetical protein
MINTAQADFSQKVVEDAKQASVRIFTFKGDDMGVGSGFVLNNQGHVVTNYHVIEGAEKVGVAYARGNIVIMKEARVVVSEPGKDLAILKCDVLPKTRSITVVGLRTTSSQAVMAIGFPGVLDEINPSDMSTLRETGRPDEYTVGPEDASAFEPVTFPGHVGKEMPLDSGYGGIFKSIAHSAKISGGNSGGPLIDRGGRVVGINVAGAGTELGEQYAFAIHASELIALARANSIPITIATTRVSTSSFSRLQILLYVAVAGLLLILFLMVLRKPRMAMVDAMSRVVHSARHTPKHTERRQSPPIAHPPPPRPQPSSPSQRTMRIRGRDTRGQSYDLPFTPSDFQRHGNRLVIGRKADLSQLVLPQDSISRQHATITLVGGSTIQIEDRNSGNGTRVNGRELAVGQPPATLSPGDKITLGEIDLIFEITD